MELAKDLKSRQEVRDLVDAAAKAQQKLQAMDQQSVDRIVESMAKAAAEYAKELAQLAVEETGFGNVPHKTEKNLFASRTVWNAIRELKTIGILREDHEKQVWDVGVPVGVVAGIVPSTNPTSTIIYKSLVSLKGGNAIVFSPHPNAVRCSLRAVEILKAAAEKAGCPGDAIGCISMPTMDAVEELMKHRQVRLILATGGSAMVRAAYSSGTPAIGVGAGNGPAYLHPDCDLPQAVSHIVRSKTFDNGVICASEQSIILQRKNAAEAEAELHRQGCVILSETDAKKLAAILFRANGTINPKIVGKTASEIAAMADLSTEARSAKILVARENGVGTKFPYSMEKLCPVLGLYTVEDEDAALRLACEILYHEGSGHTFVIHAKDEAVVRRFSVNVPVSRFLVNTPAALGGIGATTGLFPALTLGCGAVGGSSSSNNIGPLDLINIRRVAWGHKERETTHTTRETNLPAEDSLLEILTEKLLQRILEKENVR